MFWPFSRSLGYLMSVQKQFDTTNFKNNWSTYVILGLALGAMLFFGVCNPSSFVDQLDNVAGSVDGEEITQSEFRRAYSSEMERERQRAGENAGDIRIAGKVLDQLLSYRILFLEAKKMGLVVPDEEIIAYLGEVKAFRDKDGKFSNEVFHGFLRNNRYSEASFMEDLRRNLTVDRLRDLVSGTSHVSNGDIDFDYRLRESKVKVDYIKVDPEKIPIAIIGSEIQAFLAATENTPKIKGYFDSHQSEYNVPEKIHVRHILVSYKGARGANGDATKRSEDEAKKRAESLLTQVRASGADFSAIAKKETDDPTGKNNGGDLGFFAKEAMVKEFSDAAFTLTAGQIAGPVKSPFGYHLIQCVDKKAAINTTLEQARESIAQNLIKQNKVQSIAKETAGKIMAALKEKRPVDELLKGIAAEWKTTEEFALNTNYITGVGNNPKLIEGVLALKEQGQLVAEPIEVQKSFYIVRLNSRRIADASVLDAKKREDMAMNLSYRNGYLFFQSFEQNARDKYEKRNAIHRNPQYLALDTSKSE